MTCPCRIGIADYDESVTYGQSTLPSQCILRRHKIQQEFLKLRKENKVANVKITCITKPHPLSPHEHITHVGNPDAGWEWTREQVIASIEAKENTFFVDDPKTGKRSYVGVVRVAGKAPYLRTHADGDWNNNLLSLDQCPVARR